jgi:hypothetical protein
MVKPDTAKTCRGYGAQLHGERREGYPSDQATPANGSIVALSWCIRVSVAASRDGSQCAKDATSRPEKPDVLSLPERPFFTRRGKIFNQINSL